MLRAGRWSWGASSPATETNDTPAVLLLAAVAKQARKDASAGDAVAGAWLAELASVRPGGRWRFSVSPLAVAAD